MVFRDPSSKAAGIILLLCSEPDLRQGRSSKMGKIASWPNLLWSQSLEHPNVFSRCLVLWTAVRIAYHHPFWPPDVMDCHEIYLSPASGLSLLGFPGMAFSLCVPSLCVVLLVVLHSGGEYRQLATHTPYSPSSWSHRGSWRLGHMKQEADQLSQQWPRSSPSSEIFWQWWSTSLALPMMPNDSLWKWHAMMVQMPLSWLHSDMQS